MYCNLPWQPVFPYVWFGVSSTLEALKKSVEQRQELDDAIDQCEQAPLRDVSGQISLAYSDRKRDLGIPQKLVFWKGNGTPYFRGSLGVKYYDLARLFGQQR